MTGEYRIEWRDLSDSELKLRLMIRGASPALAHVCTTNRDREWWAEQIERILRP